MPDRTINFGESEAEATYQIQDTDGAAGGGNFVVAKDTNANTVLLEYDPGTDSWEYAGDVDLNGGTLTAGSVNTDDLLIGELSQAKQIDSVSATGGSTLDISSFDSFTNVRPQREIIIRLWYDSDGTEQNLDVRFNGDGGSTGDYNYVQEDGTEQPTENQIRLLNQSAPFSGGLFTISLSRFFDPLLTVDSVKVREKNANAIALRGSKATDEELNSVQFIPSQSSGNLTAQVIEAQYVQP